jgi:hypothetical protein
MKSANNQRYKTATAKPRSWMPTPKTSLPATMVKNENETGICQVPPDYPRKSKSAQYRQNCQPRKDHGIRKEQQVGQFTTTFLE